MPMLGARDAAAKPLVAPADARVLLRGAEGLDGVADAWKRLEPRTVIPMAHHAWTKSFASTLELEHRMHVFAASTSAGGVAVAGLARRDGFLAPLELPGADELGEPMDFAYDDSLALEELCRAIARTPWPLEVPRLPADSPTVGALARAYAGRGVVVQRPARPYPFVPLDPSWVEPEAHLTPRRRSDLRRARRHAERMGALSCAIVAPSPDEVGPLLDEAFRVEASGWKGRACTALALDTAIGSFFRKYAAEAAGRGLLRVGLLRIGDRAAAMQLAVQHGDRYWLLKIGYDEAFAPASPGLLLLCESLRRAAADGLTSYEFLGGIAPWIKPWTPHERACVAVSAYPWSAQGLCALGSRALGHAVRRIGRISSWKHDASNR
ncbi:GNAT family N-acetyltransferase [Polyangium aurulentum]|uniref:GNAT family N-acetyltransferase n=1 Tax=Polyangium aurulentum TaxID=2567896 RepID=UPI00146A007A|nr:GNAT family N-acetyltransferase [Polyangium aurulentum]UQA59024.1 GNAT family N-acetyltransferase [Polyangium aurulentum]